MGLSLLLLFQMAWSQVIAPSAQEVRFAFKSSVVVEKNSGHSPIQIAELQASYLFGIFSSPENVSSYGLDPVLVGGIGAPKKEMNIKIISRRQENGKLRFDYESSGTFLFHNRAAERLLRQGVLKVALPLAPLETYDSKCTDPHYPTFSDFWYFYNPFRAGCEYLYAEPMAIPVEITLRSGVPVKQDSSPRLDLLHGNNGNGDLFSIYVVHGYSESSKDPRDDGRLGFKNYNKFLRGLGFQETEFRSGTSYPLTVFTGPMLLPNGKTMQVEIRHALVETDAESRNVTFAKFFKEAVEHGDVVIYTGHSGLGSNLDIPYLESKAGQFIFPTGKRQIFFFESCSSYSYYLDHFRFQKTRATIDVVTNGLSSYFETSHDVLTMFTAHMLNPKGGSTTWMKILQDMESPLEGGSYLLNVGGL